MKTGTAKIVTQLHTANTSLESHYTPQNSDQSFPIEKYSKELFASKNAIGYSKEFSSMLIPFAVRNGLVVDVQQIALVREGSWR